MQWDDNQPTSPDGRTLILLGLVIGTIISLAVWIPSWNPLLGRGGLGCFSWLIPIAKLLLGAIFLDSRRWRKFGTGLLMSLAPGALILFIGTCAMHPIL